MIWQVIVYALGVAVAFAAVGLGLERLAAHLGLPRRSAWAVAMLASVLFPLAVIVATPPRKVTAAVPVLPDVQELGDASFRPVTAPGERQVAQIAKSHPAARLDATSPAGRSTSARFGLSIRVTTGLWLAGSISIALYLLVASARLRRRTTCLSREVVQDIEVIVSESMGPALMGVWRPRIIVPRWFMEQSPQTQQLILEHEQQHIVARDPLLLWSGFVLVIAVPWNLPIWWQLRRLRLAIELDCDARVLRGGAEAQQYGEVLLTVTRRAIQAPRATMAMSAPISALERRIRNLMPRAGRRPLLRVFAAASLCLIGVGAAVAVDAPVLRTVVMPRPYVDPVLSQLTPITAPSLSSVAAAVAAPKTPAAVGALLPALPAMQVSAAAQVVPGTTDSMPPLLPIELPDRQQQFAQIQPVILKKYPEILTAPAEDTTYVVAMSLRSDGSIRASDLRLSSSGRLVEDREFLRQLFSDDGGQAMEMALPKGSKLANGAELPAPLFVMYQMLPSGYDESRSMLAVQNAVRAKYSQLLKSEESDTLNSVTVLMTEDGKIDRDLVGTVDMRNAQPNSAGQERLFARFRSMGLDPGQLAFVSGTGIHRRADGKPGRATVFVDSNGIWRKQPEDVLLIYYAWPRRPGEAAGAQQPSLDTPQMAAYRALTAALVQKHFPDAFRRGDSPDNTLLFVLSAAGHVVRTSRVTVEKNMALSPSFIQSLAPDLKLGSSASFGNVRNSSGETVNAIFTWLAP